MSRTQLGRVASGEHDDPHAVLGVHRVGRHTVLRAWCPDATSVRAVLDDATTVALSPVVGIDGVFSTTLAAAPATYRLALTWADGSELEVDDPYRFWPTLGEVDLHLIGEGRHEELWRVLGSTPRRHQSIDGTSFAVWAPNARAVRVVGDWNRWDGRIHPMRRLGTSGVWEIFVPGVGPGQHYKYEIVGADGRLQLKADPMANACELAPGSASRVTASTHRWGDDAWMAQRAQRRTWAEPMSIYEVHLGSWRGPRSYRALAIELVDHVVGLGFTHVELLPVAEHPFTGSWGYQVTGYFAPTARYGDPDDFRFFVDECHRRGLGVILDWVPAHFPKDDWALARFDGTALYEHDDPRQGEHPDWGTYVFNYGRREVRNFLLASALYWLEEFHIDGLRVDAVASMIYLDYSREPGDWVPNVFGGRENLDAVSFLQEVNATVYRRNPGVAMIAEESTSWPGVTTPTEHGGLGFGHKWNMGWMHDTLGYFGHQPVHRPFHHNDLTFGLLYAFTEHFVLPLSHDEVVHGKGTLLSRMPGDPWQAMANLRALFGWMWALPGKQLVFMGAELGAVQEWSVDASLDWSLLDDPLHAGLSTLVGSLNHLYRDQPALWSSDSKAEGFRWLDADDADHSIYSFARFDAESGAAPIVCVANLTPVPRAEYRLGLPDPGIWHVVLDTDAPAFGGSGVTVGPDHLMAEAVPTQGCDHSVVVALPPLSVLWFSPSS